MELNERKMRVLQAIVDDYIASGVPVGSRTISRLWGGELSAATIRNEMSDLEEMGFLEQPHTSAGRIPSDMAYRLYVDQLLHVSGLSLEERKRIKRYLHERIHQVEDVMDSMAHVLSEVTDYISIVLAPQMRTVTFKTIRIVPVTPGKALVVIVATGGIYRDIMIDIPADMDDRHLDMISNALSEAMLGKTLDDLPAAMETIQKSINYHSGIFQSLLDAIGSSEQREITKNIMFDGARNIFKHPEYANMENAQNLLAALDAREYFFNMLNKAQGMHISISIGSENEHESLQDASIVTATYMIGEKNAGSFGVIGPTRMNYAKVISIVDFLSNCINEILSERED